MLAYWIFYCIFAIYYLLHKTIKGGDKRLDLSNKHNIALHN